MEKERVINEIWFKAISSSARGFTLYVSPSIWISFSREEIDRIFNLLKNLDVENIDKIELYDAREHEPFYSFER